MTIRTETKVNLMEDKVYLHKAISALQRNMTDFEIERNERRRAKWYSNRNKYNDDLNKIEESLNERRKLRPKEK